MPGKPVEEAVLRLSRDLTKAAKNLDEDEARFLVDAYYIMQEDRKRSGSQVRALGEAKEPNSILKWFNDQTATLENQIKRALDTYSAANPLGEWARDQIGIGPVIAAGLLAHIDLDKAQTVSGVWRYAGLDPTSVWKKGEKRPWNASLKVLCWKIGESFMKQSGHEDCYYGEILLKRWKYEKGKNTRGEFADQALHILRTKNIGKTTDAYQHYSDGKLPPAHILARAKRYAVKQFLSDYFVKGYQILGKTPPKPYPIERLGHTHLRKVPA